VGCRTPALAVSAGGAAGRAVRERRATKIEESAISPHEGRKRSGTLSDHGNRFRSLASVCASRSTAVFDLIIPRSRVRVPPAPRWSCMRTMAGGSLPSAAGEAPVAVLCPARVSSLRDAELDALVAEAVVDCYDEHAQLSGLFAMIEDNLVAPFGTEVLGVPVVVRKVDRRSSGIVATCHRGRLRRPLVVVDETRRRDSAPGRHRPHSFPVGRRPGRSEGSVRPRPRDEHHSDRRDVGCPDRHGLRRRHGGGQAAHPFLSHRIRRRGRALQRGRLRFRTNRRHRSPCGATTSTHSARTSVAASASPKRRRDRAVPGRRPQQLHERLRRARRRR
jgi:hypothetical protein